ncbi:hypothetical protein L2E82_49776 [Cichorium intybus]|uniref:Uncharacterized protein n=1 Tax=Cichorium intybus TaxID=13427 RepID=A0ACB8Z0A6_CICIN|nr:hypothetical protein L2E82_49776 [Cichorium intybus]
MAAGDFSRSRLGYFTPCHDQSSSLLNNYAPPPPVPRRLLSLSAVVTSIHRPNQFPSLPSSSPTLMFLITSSADDQGKKNINEILGPKIIGVDVRNQADFDAIMLEIDGTPKNPNGQ